MTGRVFTITSGKGGVGKTTLVANLGIALAMQGQRVVVADADVGLRNLDVLMGLDAGMDAALTLTGATTEQMLAESEITPTYVIHQLAQLLPVDLS